MFNVSNILHFDKNRSQIVMVVGWAYYGTSHVHCCREQYPIANFTGAPSL
jgi:hypothetical protein